MNSVASCCGGRSIRGHGRGLRTDGKIEYVNALRTGRNSNQDPNPDITILFRRPRYGVGTYTVHTPVLFNPHYCCIVVQYYNTYPARP